MTAQLLSVQTGRIAPLGPDQVPSGFVKTSRQGAVRVGLLGLEGDSQADLTVHGGAEKAVYAYAAAHYPDWAAQFPKLAASFHGGAMGENLTVAGMTEADICVGDVHAAGTALLQVCQPRRAGPLDGRASGGYIDPVFSSLCRLHDSGRLEGGLAVLSDR